MTISNREKKIILIVLGVLILVASYFLIFTSKSSENETLQAQNSSLQAKVLELQARIAKEQEMKTETERMNNELMVIVYSFPSFLRAEDGISNTISMEENQKIEVTSLTIADSQLLALTAEDGSGNTASGGDTQSTENSDTNTDANENENENEGTAADASSSAPSDGTADQGSLNSSASTRYSVYEVNTALSYECNYKSLKELLGLFEDYSKRRSVQEVMATFDNSTGKIDGTMSYNSYFLIGSDKPYADYIPEVSLGTDNVFGTIE